MPPLAGRLAQWRSICPQCARQQVRYSRQRKLLHGSARMGQEKSILARLEERGYINSIAGDRNKLERLLQTRKVGFYAGIDPTAPSLHLGHLLPLMVLFWLYHHGHNVVSLVGGGTARTGDPSGRLTSRAKMANSVLQSNFETMFAQVERIWQTAKSYGLRHDFAVKHRGTIEVLNNAVWLEKLHLLDFLGMNVGTRLGPLLGRDTVRNKMEKGDGMSLPEFIYPLLQGWDWWHMYQHHGVQVQIGGSDQYGNIIAGMDAIKQVTQSHSEDTGPVDWLDADGRLKEDLRPMGLTVPLLTTASGEKFGKSAGNAIWLDRSMTSPFDLYGFLLRSSDDDVERYLKLFTFIPTSDIASVMAEHLAEPGKRKAQHLLASEVIELVHGEEEATKTRREHQILHKPSLSALSQRMADAEVDPGRGPAQTLERAVLPTSLVLNTPFSRILYHAGIVATKSEGARLIAKGGAYVAQVKSTNNAMSVPTDAGQLTFVQLRDQKPNDVQQFVLNGMLVFRIGKWKTRVVEIVEDADFDARKLEAPGWEEWKIIRPQRAS